MRMSFTRYPPFRAIMSTSDNAKAQRPQHFLVPIVFHKNTLRDIRRRSIFQAVVI